MIGKIVSKIKTKQQLRRKVEVGNKASDKVWLYNFWNVKAEEMWVTRFLKHRGLLKTEKRLSFYSVFGDKKLLDYDNRNLKIFITGENIHAHSFDSYADNLLSSKEIGLSLGFDYLDNAKYVRFPLWLRTAFQPEWTEKEIINRVEQLRFPEIGDRTKFAAMIARYDWGDTRSKICKALENIGDICCPSKVLHNDETLKTVYQDDKQAYLRQFCFNVCPENSNWPGYVTEKVFDSISAGCIPIYWGSDNKPELDVLNQNALILWDFDADNAKNIAKIENLWNNKEVLYDMLHQPRLVDGAEDVILAYFSRLENAFAELL